MQRHYIRRRGRKEGAVLLLLNSIAVRWDAKKNADSALRNFGRRLRAAHERGALARRRAYCSRPAHRFDLHRTYLVVYPGMIQGSSANFGTLLFG